MLVNRTQHLMSDLDLITREELHRGRSHWVSFLVLGLVLLVCGAAAILAPAYSTIATSTLLGLVLAIGGAITIAQAINVRDWAGFNWQILLGAAEVVGGILIVANPLKGAAAVSLLVAIVIMTQGVVQLGLAWRVRPGPGWVGIFIAGVAAVVISIALVLRFPYASVESPGAMAGLALVFGGVAYVIMAFGNMKAAPGRDA